MSTNLIVALIVLPLMGALIAWAGDLIGYRLGRTRRSLFGLRPRTTATLVGAAFGAALPLAGLGFAMIVSPDARDALLRIDMLRQEAADLGRQNTTLMGDIRQARGEARSARQRATEANSTLSQAQRNLAGTQGELAQSRGALGATREALAQARGSLAAAKSGLARAQAELGRQRADLRRARLEVRQARGALSDAKGQLAVAQTEYKQAQGELVAKQGELSDAQLRVMSVQAELEPLRNMQRQFNTAKQEYDQLQVKLAATEQQLARYRVANQAIVEKDVAFEPGQEIVRAYVDTDLTQEQTEAMLNLFLDRASRAASEGHGIARGANGRAVRAISPVPVGLLPGQAAEDEIIATVATQIRSGQAEAYVVLIRAWGRTFAQQPEEMAVEFWAAPNKVVFKAGDAILQATIDGGEPRDRVFGELWAMVKDVRRVAADRGMLPSARTGLYGEVPADDLLNALDRVLAIGGPARVKAVVARDARVAPPESAPMSVGLDVEPLVPKP